MPNSMPKTPGTVPSDGGEAMTARTYEQRAAAQLHKEIQEFEGNPQATGQAILDRLWQARLDEAEEQRRLMRELNPIGLRIWG